MLSGNWCDTSLLFVSGPCLSCRLKPVKEIFGVKPRGGRTVGGAWREEAPEHLPESSQGSSPRGKDIQKRVWEPLLHSNSTTSSNRRPAWLDAALL